MPRLSQIPEEKLEEIAKFVKEMKGKIPIKSQGDVDLVREVEKRFGVKLSPSQISMLQRGYKTYKVKLPVDVARRLEEEYGDVSKGLLQVAREVEAAMEEPPKHLKKALEALRGREMPLREAEEALRGLGYVDVHSVIGELCKLGYAKQEGTVLKVYKKRIPPELLLVKYLGFRW